MLLLLEHRVMERYSIVWNVIPGGSVPRQLESGKQLALFFVGAGLFDLGVDAFARSDFADQASKLPRKEVIQPHLPVQLPCYDFTPITSPALDACLLS